MKTISNRRRPCRRSQGGFTLLEMLIAISLMSLLFLGGMDLVVSAARTTTRTTSQMNATGDAANSIQSVIGLLREAQQFRLPTADTTSQAETGWVTPTNMSQSQFSTTVNAGIVNSAIEITAPPALTPTLNLYKTGVAHIQVQLSSGSAKDLIGTDALYSSQTGGSVANPTVVTLIYRGDPDGAPDPDPTNSAVTGAGTYLWQYVIPSTGNFAVTKDAQGNFLNPTPLCKSVSTAPNAVQFVRPSLEANQVEVKIISGYYSPINGTQTNEEGDGTSASQLTGKCVYMRDHLASGTPSNASQSSNNPFQHN